MKIAIVGGGPSGSLCAILLKTQCKNNEVHLFEQRPKFERSITLLINSKSIDELLPKKVVTKIMKNRCFVRPPPIDRTGRCYVNRTKEHSMAAVRISVLEEWLWEEAKRVGVIVHRPTKKKKPFDLSTVSEFDVVVGADGSKSNIRKYLGIPIVKKRFSYGLVATWKHKPQEVKLKPRLMVGTPQNRFRKFDAGKNQKVDYGGIQLSKQEYNLWKNVKTYKNIPEKLISTVKTFEDVYGIDAQQLESSVKFSSFPVTLYKATKLSQVKNGTLFFLIGDAALGVSYFSGTGVNAGFEMANAVSKIEGATQVQKSKNYNKTAKMILDIAIKKSKGSLLNFNQKCLKQVVDKVHTKLKETGHYRLTDKEHENIYQLCSLTK